MYLRLSYNVIIDVLTHRQPIIEMRRMHLKSVLQRSRAIDPSSSSLLPEYLLLNRASLGVVTAICEPIHRGGGDSRWMANTRLRMRDRTRNLPNTESQRGDYRATVRPRKTVERDRERLNPSETTGQRCTAPPVVSSDDEGWKQRNNPVLCFFYPPRGGSIRGSFFLIRYFKRTKKRPLIEIRFVADISVMPVTI